MTDVDDLADLIAEAPFTRTGHTVMFTDPTARLVAQRIIDAGYRRVVIDDATIERAAAELVRQQTSGNCDLGRICDLCDCFADVDTPPGHHRDGYARDHARAALIAALGDDQ